MIFSTDDILKGWVWRGKELPPETVAQLKDEAIKLHDSLLWKILTSEVKWFSIKSLMEQGKDGADIERARLLHNMIDVMDGKLIEMSKE